MGKATQLCSVSTIPSAVKCLNSRLNVLDFAEISIDNDDKNVIAQLVNVCYELTSAVKKCNAKINSLNEDGVKYQMKVEQNRKEKDRLEYELEKRRISYEHLKNSENLKTTQLAELTSQVKKGNLEVSRLQRAMSVQKLRHEHEVRRKNETLKGMREKLYKSFSNESCLADGQRLAASTHSVLSSDYDRTVNQLHNNLQVVLGENAQYRALLENINDKVSVEMADFEEYRHTDLSGLPCDKALAVVEHNFLLFLERLCYTDQQLL